MSVPRRKALVTTEGAAQTYWTIEALREYLLTIIEANEIKYSE